MNAVRASARTDEMSTRGVGDNWWGGGGQIGGGGGVSIEPPG